MVLYTSVNAFQRLQAVRMANSSWEGLRHTWRISGIWAGVIAAQSTARITSDVQRRLKVHNSGKGSAYVRAHRPAKLVAFTASESRSAASSLEYSVISLSRAQKLALAKKWKTSRACTAQPACLLHQRDGRIS